MHHIVDIVLGLIGEIGYVWIFVMMTIESSFIPFPSEVAMIPAWYLSALWEMNLWLAFLSGTLWALLGASINYYLGMKYGAVIIRSMIHRYGKYILLKESHYLKSEEYFASHGAITTLVGRFIPAVRQLISIPAGIFKMNFSLFIFLTFVGAGTWNAILMTIWYIAWKNDELVKRLLSEAFLIVIIILWAIIMLYIAYVKSQAKKLRKIEKTIEYNHKLEEKKIRKKKK